MKLKVLKRENKEVETDLELPVYLYFQDEFCNDEVVKITDRAKVTVKFDLIHGVSINVDEKYFVEEHHVNERNLTNEEHFNELYSSAMDYLNKLR